MKKIIALIVFALVLTKGNAQFGVSVNYLAPTKSQTASLKHFLFLKQAWEFGANYKLPVAKKIGVKLEASLISGSSDENQPAAYAKEHDVIYTEPRPKMPPWKMPSVFVLTGGPSAILFMSKKAVLTLDVTAGALFSKKLNLEYLNQQGGVVKSITIPSTSFIYNPKVVLGIPIAKKMLLNFNVGYSSVAGVQVGGGITFGKEVLMLSNGGISNGNGGWHL